MLQDYIRDILNQNRTSSTWALFPTGKFTFISTPEVFLSTSFHVGTIKTLIENVPPEGRRERLQHRVQCAVPLVKFSHFSKAS